MSKPRGYTNAYFLKLFRNGFSIPALARAFKCEEHVIDQAIRAALTPGGKR